MSSTASASDPQAEEKEARGARSRREQALLFLKEEGLLSILGASLVSLSAHFILVFPVNLLGLVAGLGCYFRVLGRVDSVRRERTERTARPARPVRSVRSGFWSGFLFGLLVAAGCLYWLTDVLYVLTTVERLAGVGVILGWMLIVALPYGLWAGAVRWWMRRGWRCPPLVQAFGLLLVQVLIQEVWLGFPWLQYGYWLADGPFGVWLGILGARWVGLLLLAGAAGLGLWGLVPGAKVQALVAGLVFGAVLVLPGPSGSKPEDETGPVLRVALVSVERAVHEDSEEDDLALLSRYAAATRKTTADWVFWPESVIRNGEANLGPLAVLLAEPGKRQRVLAGALLRAPGGGKYNALVELPGVETRYYKQRLVPFSEYVPGVLLRRLFASLGVSTLKNNVVARETPAPEPAMELGDGRVGVAAFPLICYEAAFTELILPDERPAILLHVGNEGWFRSAIVHRMLWAMSAARALEYGLPLVRVAVNGTSGVFDPSRNLRWVHGGSPSGPVVIEEALVRPRPVSTFYGTLYGRVRRRFSDTHARP